MKSIIAHVESLERRMLMDGTIKVALSGGDLLVTGDGADNIVKITRPAAGKVRIAGLDDTKINGAAYKDFLASTFDDLKIRLRQGGDDAVQIQGPIMFAGDVDAQLGNGEFVVEGSAGPVEVGEELIVQGGAECDVKLRNEVIVRGNTTIQTGGAATAGAGLGIVPDIKAAKFSDPLNIDNPYFPLVPGAKYVYESKGVDEETGEAVIETIVVEVTNQTKTIMGVKNRVVRDRVYQDGLLIEDTFDWHCQDDNGNVWYFGENTKDFEYDDDGNLIGTSVAGAWQAGVDGALPGIIMQAKPKIGSRYYQEFAPGDVLDAAQVLTTGETTKIPVGTYYNVVRTSDGSVIEPEAFEHKLYGPGLGLIKEEKFDLITGEIHTVVKMLSATLNGSPVRRVVATTGFTGVNPTGKAGGPIRMFGETVIRADDAVIVREARFADEVWVYGKSEVALVDSVFEDFSVQAADAVGLRNVTATEEVLIRGNVDVFVFGSRLYADTEILLGGGDNELVIGKSAFGDLDADGGGGENTFDDRGGNTFGELELTRFDD